MDHSYISQLISGSMWDAFLNSLDLRVLLTGFFTAVIASIYFLLEAIACFIRPSPPQPAFPPAGSARSGVPASPVRVEVRIDSCAPVLRGKPDLFTVAKVHAYLACGQSLDQVARFINPSYAHWTPMQKKEYTDYLQAAVTALARAAIDGCIVRVN